MDKPSPIPADPQALASATTQQLAQWQALQVQLQQLHAQWQELHAKLEYARLMHKLHTRGAPGTDA